jgi:hypothetical protein
MTRDVESEALIATSSKALQSRLGEVGRNKL